MEKFQDGAFPNLEYHLFQVTWCFQHCLGNATVTSDTHSGNRHILI